METRALWKLNGEHIAIPEEEITRLSGALRGRLLNPESEGYHEARSIWNGMIDRHPGLIAQCAGVADVIQAVNFAREHDLLVSVCGRGHNIAGNAVCEGGLMIDLSRMRAVRVDPAARTAWVEPGCTLRDFDHEAQAFGLATPLGINSTTGIAGLTLGGGFGWLSRKYGMTVDNLLSADIVTADGRFVHASAEENDDLFWAIRGGGGNFGVVTAFEFRLHPIGREVLSGLIVHPLDAAPELLRYYRDFAATLPDETGVWVVVRKAPPLPFIPEKWHGKEVVVLAAFHTGDLEAGERNLAPLRHYGNPIADVIAPHSYEAWQQAFDPLLTPGARNYWKSHDFATLEDGLLDQLIAYAERLPSPHCEVFLGQLGGQMGRSAQTATAYPHRGVRYVMNVHARWDDLSDDDSCIDWARSLFRDTAPYATGGVYVNFLTRDEEDRVQAAYGPNYERLVHVKDAYDPQNLFRFNQNIRPTAYA